MDKIPINLGNILNKIRIKRFVKQREIASYIGVKINTYSQYENGIRTPTIFTLLRIAEYYDITLDQLIKGDL